LFVIKQEDNLFSVVGAKNYQRMALPVPSEPMLGYTCPAALRETKHTCPDPSGTTQDFFIFFIDLKKGTLPTMGG